MRGPWLSLAVFSVACAAANETGDDTGDDDDTADAHQADARSDAQVMEMADAARPNDAAPPDAAASLCTGGDLSVTDPTSGHCYMLFLGGDNWGTARTLCEGLSPPAHLASIESLQENDFVWGFIGARNVWIGGSDAITEMQWQWVDGTPWIFTNWDSDEPNDDGTEDCAVMRGNDDNGDWNDGDCPDAYPYVCEREE